MTSYTSASPARSQPYGPSANSPSCASEQQAKRTAEPPNALKSALVYLVSSLLCALFGAIYELFSHEVYSYFMIYAFAIPLALGALPNLVCAITGLRAPGKLAANAWNSGVATLTVGSIFWGALEIFGTTSKLALVYPVAAAILLAAGVVLYARKTDSCAHFRRRAARRSARMPQAPVGTEGTRA